MIQAGRDLLRSPFARSVGSLMAPSALGQELNVAAAPILARLYGPEEFGLYGLFYLFITFTAMFIRLNYDIALPAALPAAVDESDAQELAESAIKVSVVIGVVLMGAIALDLMDFGHLPLRIGPLAFAVLQLQALIQVFQAWYVRRQTIATIGQAGITLNAVRSGSQIGFTFAGAGAVVNEDVPDHPPMVWVPARRVGWMSVAGTRLHGEGVVTSEEGRCCRISDQACVALGD